MKHVNHTIQKTKRPIKVLQYGEGNFLRGFVDYFIDVANEKGVFNGNIQIVKPIMYGDLTRFINQDCVYTVLLRGKVNGEVVTDKRIITCIDSAVDPFSDYDTCATQARNPELRFIVSNTTEAGIIFDENDEIESTPPSSYPGKLTKFLFDRFNHFSGAAEKGIIILPTELIDRNGDTLKNCCLRLSEKWGLQKDFSSWLVNANTFCNTLVDRITTGYPKDEISDIEKELGYCDYLLVAGESFALWVIETDNPNVQSELPLDEIGLPVIFTDNVQPYKERKVRILNGAHTSSVPAAFLSGLDTVGDMMKDKVLRQFIERIVYDEIAPMVPLSHDEVKSFADSVMERFENPFIQHNLLSITLNSVSKFKARVLPTILDTFEENGSLPPLLNISFASLIAFYRFGKLDNNTFTGNRDGNPYEIIDDTSVIDFFVKNQSAKENELTRLFLSREDFWGQDLTKITGLVEAVSNALESIQNIGVYETIKRNLG